MPRPAPPNAFGCTEVAEWSDDFGGKPLERQLADAGIETERTDMPNLAGWAGRAYLLRYTSPNDGKGRIVLCIPYMIAADSWGESYYYFPAETFTAHPHEQWWIDAYTALHEK